MVLQVPRGTRDFLHQEMIKREYLLEMIKMVFHDYGFQPMQTPAFENWELLGKKGSGGDALKDEIYYFKDKAKRELGLRFDLTVPMARVIAANPQLPKPFKRYQIARVWRYDRPQAGRYREFWQADCDIVGSSSMDCEAECIALAVNSLIQLGFKKFKVRINNRKILNGLIEIVDLKGKETEVFRILDKLDKIGEKGVNKELVKIIPKKKSEIIMDMIGKRGNPSKMIKEAKKMNSSIVNEGIMELKNIVDKCKVYGIEKMIEIDFSLVRGLDYYTGPIFEISIESKKNVGSVSGGGRYDNLVELYGGKWTPAVGISLGVERIIEIMENEGMFDQPKTRTEIFVASVNDDVRDDALRLAQEMRTAFMNVETDLMKRDIKKQLKYAASQEIPFVVFVGEDELKSKKFTVREMSDGKQYSMTIKQIISKLGKG